MNHTERRRYADAMARAAAAYMADSDARELANNLACSEPEELSRLTIADAITHRMREFGVSCRNSWHCATDMMHVVRPYQAHKSA